ncbi:MAG: HigA family addiction module antitoxin [Verrucomicrobiae bacterium]
MKPHRLRQSALASALGVMPMTVNQIVHGKRSISAEVALRLGRFFGINPQFCSTCNPTMIWKRQRMRSAAKSGR